MKNEYQQCHSSLEDEYFDFDYLHQKRTLKPDKDLDEFNQLHTILNTEFMPKEQQTSALKSQRDNLFITLLKKIGFKK